MNKVKIEPKVTVIVAAYNVELYIEELMESLVNQTYKNLEILVFDDGSKDKTPKLLDKFAEKYMQIKIIHQENIGLGATRNHGIKAATGKYITFVDGDDVLPLTAYEKLVATLEQTGSEMASGYVKRINSEKTFSTWLFKNAIRMTNVKTNIRERLELVFDSTAWNKLYNLEFMRRNNLYYPENKLYEDIPVEMKAHMLANHVDIITDLVYYWRTRDKGDASITQNRADLHSVTDRLEMLTLARNNIKNTPDFENVLNALDVKIFQHDLSVHFLAMRQRNDEFLLPFRRLFVSFVEQFDLETILPQLSVQRQVMYRSFLLGDFKSFKKYSTARFSEFQFKIVNNHYELVNEDIFEPVRNKVHLEHALTGSSLIKEIKNLDDNNIQVLGEWRFNQIKATKSDQKNTTAKIINIDTKYETEISFNGFSRYARNRVLMHKNYDAFKLTFNTDEIINKIGLGNWQIVLTTSRNNITISEILANPTSAKKLKIFIDKTKNANSIVSQYTKNWQLILNTSTFDTDILEEKRLVWSDTDYQISNDNIQITINSNRSLDNAVLHVVNNKIKFDNELQLLRMQDNYMVSVPVTVVQNGAVKFSLHHPEWRDEKISVEINESNFQYDDILVTRLAKKRNESEVRIFDSSLNCSIRLKDNHLIFQSASAADDVDKIVFESSNTENIIVNIQSMANEFQVDLNNANFVTNQYYVPTLYTIKHKRLALINDTPDTIRYGAEFTNISFVSDSSGLIKVVSKLRPTSFWDKTVRRRKFTQLILYPLMRLLPLHQKSWIFDSYWASKFASNERAIYDYLQQEHPEMKSTWVFKDPTTEITGNGTKIRENSFQYWLALARTKYFVQNANFPQSYIKRRGQIEIETLHGTFMKTMGFDEPDFKYASPKRQSDFAERIDRWDYLVSPSRFMDEIAPSAYQYKRQVLQTGFPRNDRLIHENNSERIKELKEQLKIPLDKKIILYAPTFRAKNEFDFQLDLNKFQEKLGHDYVLLVRVHYFVADQVDFDDYGTSIINMSQYSEIEDLYLISDLLITDYSSVMFDYALLKRPMIFFAYDLEWYTNPNNRGTYLDYEKSVPGPIVKTSDEVIEALFNYQEITKQYQKQREIFIEKFGTYGQKGDAAKQIVETVLHDNVDLEKQGYIRNALQHSVWKFLKINNPVMFFLNLFADRVKKNAKLVLFESFFGEQISDSPKAIYDYMRTNYPNYKLKWLVKEDNYRQFKAAGYPVIHRDKLIGVWAQLRAKYLITNARRPLSWKKPADMVLMATWHGTPLKTIGTDVLLVNMGNFGVDKYHSDVLKDSNRWDYLLAPNRYSYDRFSQAFQMEPTKMVASGYPRNDRLITDNNYKKITELKQRLQLPLDKKIVLYAPTWRDNEYSRADHYSIKLKLDLDQLQEKFGEDIHVLIRTHYLISEGLDLSSYSDIATNVSKYPDITDLYLISDVLITDYSSVFFDFSILKRPMIFFAYDLEAYANDIRGFYFDYKNVPGEVVTTNDKLHFELNNILKGKFDMNKVNDFHKLFADWEDGSAAARATHVLLKGQQFTVEPVLNYDPEIKFEKNSIIKSDIHEGRIIGNLDTINYKVVGAYQLKDMFQETNVGHIHYKIQYGEIVGYISENEIRI